MKDAEIVEKIEEFSEFLSIGTAISDMIRWLGWVFVKGLAFIVDGLESVTDDVLLIKQFFQNSQIAAFVDTIRPFLYILLAFSLLYTGYLLIFQKKFDREGMAMNLFIALAIIVVLSQGMSKANEFTDDAISAINTTELYDEGEGSLSDNIISRQLTDLLEFDKKEWATTELDPPNTLPLSMIKHLSVTEKLDEERTELELTPQGQDIVSHKLTWSVNEKELTELEDSTLMPWTNEFYYRYDINWLTLLTTLGVMAFTLFSIAYKLARLSFELTFNYILALLVAPADIHDGQKTKKIMQSILNTFLVIILIFLSMKVYMIGTAYLASELTGLAYLIALIGFSVAVVDGPNIVERLFGIDAGLKNGWGLLAGAYAGGKLISGAGGAVMNTMNRSGGPGTSGTEKEGENQGNGQQPRGGGINEKALSPNEGENGSNAQTGLATGGAVAASAMANGAAGKKGVANLSEENNGIEENGHAPSPNDGIQPSKESEIAGTGQTGNAEVAGMSGTAGGAALSGQSSKVISPNDKKGIQEPLQGAEHSENQLSSPNTSEQRSVSASGIGTGQGSHVGTAPSPNDAERSNNGTSAASSAETAQNERMVQRSAGRTDYDVESISDHSAGNTTIQNGALGTSASSSPNSGHTAAPSSSAQNRTESVNSASERQQNTTNVTRSGSDQVVDENVFINESPGSSVQGSTNVQSSYNGSTGASSFHSEVPASGGAAASTGSTNRSVVQNSTSVENTANETVVSRGQQQQNQQTNSTRVNEILRPRTHNLNQSGSNTVDRIKNYRRGK